MATGHPTRRSFLAGVAGVASLTALGVSGCGSSNTSSGPKASTAEDTKKLLPTYKQGPMPTPELPGDGKYVEPGYLKYPTDLVETVKEAPGKGSAFKTAVMYWGDPQPEQSTYMDAVNKALNAKMSFLSIPANDYDTKISALLAGGNNLPDLVSIPGWAPPVKLYDVYNKAFADLTDKLSGDNISKYPNLAAIPTSAWRAGVWGGRLYAIPSPAAQISYITLLRKDLFDKKQVKVPTNAAELEEACKALTDRSQKRFAFGYPMPTALRMHGLQSNEYPWDVIDGKMTHLWEMKEFPDVLAWCRKLYQAGYVQPDVAAGQGDQKALFKGGQIAMYSDGYDAWSGYRFATQDPGMEKGFEADGMVPFAVKGGPTKVYADASCVYITFINKKVTGDKLDELLNILNYLAAPFGSKESQLLGYGVEGDHFTMKDGVPTPTDKGSKEIKGAFYATAAGPRADYAPQAPEWTKKRHAWTSATSKMAVQLPTAGVFVNMPASLAANTKKPTDAIQAILTGKRPVSDWDAVAKEWRSSYGDQIRELYTKAVEVNK